MELSRRSFVSAAAAGVVLTAGASTAQADDVKETSPVASNLTPDETVDADVVVIGCGSAGMCAALTAAEAGAQVVVLEKQDHIGGNSRFPEGLFAVNSPLQEAEGIECPTKLEIISHELQFSNFRLTWDYWSNFIDGSGASIQWLLDHGVRFDRVDTMFGSKRVFHYAEGGVCTQLSEALIEAVESNPNIEVRLSTPAIALKKDGDAVTGAYGEVGDGTVVLVNAKAVILSSGGFSSDPQMIADLIGYDVTWMTPGYTSSTVGDGRRMALEAGAAPAPCGTLTYPSSVNRAALKEAYVVCSAQPYLCVNEHAHRYMWEDLAFQSMCLVVRANMAQRKAFQILDAQEAARVEKDGPFSKRYTYLAFEPVPGLCADLDRAAEFEPYEDGTRTIYKADTIEELAEQMGLDPEELVATVERYNELCDKGVDEDFGKDPQYLIPVRTPPFYAFRQSLGCQSSLGGIDIDPANRVVDAEGNPIPGLWAGGSDAAKIAMETYNIEVPGSFLGYCVYSGRTMGQAAAEYALA